MNRSGNEKSNERARKARQRLDAAYEEWNARLYSLVTALIVRQYLRDIQREWGLR